MFFPASLFLAGDGRIVGTWFMGNTYQATSGISNSVLRRSNGISHAHKQPTASAPLAGGDVEGQALSHTGGVSIRAPLAGGGNGRLVGVGGFRDPEHLVRRASQPHDSPRLGVRAPSLALPKRPWRRPAPRARRPRARLLQCHPAAQGVEVRSRDPDASDARRLGERANELERHLHGAGRSLRIPCGGRTRSRCRPAHAH